LWGKGGDREKYGEEWKREKKRVKNGKEKGK
jgi:hypothetical protein